MERELRLSSSSSVLYSSFGSGPVSVVLLFNLIGLLTLMGAGDRGNEGKEREKERNGRISAPGRDGEEHLLIEYSSGSGNWSLRRRDMNSQLGICGS